MGDLPDIGLPHLRTQDTKNKQASHDNLDAEVKDRLEREIQRLYRNANDLYQFALSQGVAKECARSMLPIGTPTRLYMNGTLRSWVHFIETRAGVETQLEHRLIAEDCKKIFIQQFPSIAEAKGWTTED